MKKQYVGDGVYCTQDEWGNIILTVEDGFEVTNTIVLELGVLQNLLMALHDEGIIGNGPDESTSNDD